MEIQALLFNPPENIQKGTTFLEILDTRFEAGVFLENTYPEPLTLSPEAILIPSEKDTNTTHRISLSQKADSATIFFRREVARKISSHVLIDSEGNLLPSRRRRIFLGNNKANGEYSEIGIARRIGRQKYALEMYISTPKTLPAKNQDDTSKYIYRCTYEDLFNSGSSLTLAEVGYPKVNVYAEVPGVSNSSFNM